MNPLDPFRGAGRYTIDIAQGVADVGPPVVLNYGSFYNYELRMSLKLPRQIIRLRSIKVLLDSVDSAKRMRTLAFKFPFIGYNHNVDNSPSRIAFTFPLNTDSVLTYEHALEKPLYMSKDAEQIYRISIEDADGNVATGINCVYLDFETELGSVAV